MIGLSKLPADSFTFSRWRKCDIFERFGFACCSRNILANSHIIRKYAVGWAKAESLFCRPKINNYAVMFLIDEEYSWCHLRNNEFRVIFGEKND